MKPTINIIPNCNVPITMYGKDQKEYLLLPAYKEEDGRITIRWRLSWKERFQVLLNGSIWQQILTFNKHLQPQKLITECPYTKDDFKAK